MILANNLFNYFHAILLIGKKNISYFSKEANPLIWGSKNEHYITRNFVL